MDVCVGRSQALGRKVPVAYLTCNGSPPVGDTPSLMTFREVGEDVASGSCMGEVSPLGLEAKGRLCLHFVAREHEWKFI